MLSAFVLLLRSVGLICCGHRGVALENLALRHPLAALRRTRRPQFRTSDRLFWVLLAKAWPDWRSALIIVRPGTVVRWHRQWLRRRWRDDSTRSRPVTEVIAQINPILRGWVHYFAVGHSSRCFSYIRDWVDKKIRHHLVRASQRPGFGWKRWSNAWLYGTLGLFAEYRVAH